MSNSNINALYLSHAFMAQRVRPGDFCIDATAGRGGDTAYLCSLVGPGGRVLAMDIQQAAVDSTTEKIRSLGYGDIARVVLDSHENMARYARPDSVRLIAFNFGWLPGGDHTIFTRPASSIAAIRAGLPLLCPGGAMSLCIYYGRDCGFQERDALLDYLSTLDFRRYTVFVTSFHNRPNNPPIPVFITRDAGDTPPLADTRLPL